MATDYRSGLGLSEREIDDIIELRGEGELSRLYSVLECYFSSNEIPEVVRTGRTPMSARKYLDVLRAEGVVRIERELYESFLISG